MSLEAALQTATEAVLKLTAALANLSIPAGAPAAAEAATATGKNGKGKKNAAEIDELGNPAGTKYFHVPEGDSIYANKPGEAAVTMKGGVEITAAEFKAHGARLTEKHLAEEALKKANAEAAAAGAAGGDDDPFAASEPEIKVDQKTMTDKLMELAKAKGREVIVTLLKELGAPNVPGIPADKYQDAYKMAVELLAA